MVQVYIKEVFIKYKVLNKIILDKDIKFISAFWQVFIVEWGIKIVISIAYHPQTDG
jgi:hypothetical protein